MYRSWALVILASLVLTACTFGRDWSTYRIRIVTDPKGAECYFEREGVITQASELTPVDITLTSIGEDIGIVCAREGYKAASTTVEGGSWQNIFIRYNRHRERVPERTVYLSMAPTDSTESSTSAPASYRNRRGGFSFR